MKVVFRYSESRSGPIIYADAQSVLSEALTRAREDQNYFALSQLLIVAGTAAASSNVDRAIHDLRESNETSQQKGFQHVFAWSAIQLAEIDRYAGDLDAAEALASRGIEVMRTLEDRYHLPQDLALLAGLEARKGNFERADQLYSEVTDVIDALLVNVTRRQSLTEFLDSVRLCKPAFLEIG